MQFGFFFPDPMVQISIDDSRNILFTRSEKGSIQVYDLGEDGKGMGRVTALSQQATLHSAANIAR